MGTNMIKREDDGAIERCKVMKISQHEHLISHFFNQFLVILTQIGLFALVFYFMCEEEVEKEVLILIYLEIMLVGICGLFLGASCSLFIKNPRNFTFTAIQLILTLFFTSSLIWPIDSAHEIIKKTAKFTPTTLSVESVISILYRELNFTNPKVFMGFLVPSIYILLCLFSFMIF